MAADAAPICVNRRGLFFPAAANAQPAAFSFLHIRGAEVLDCVGTASVDFFGCRIETLFDLD
jgi:hypothetical protein